MKKKLISVMLCAAMATTMFSSVAVHAEGDDEGEIYMFISQPEYADAITTLIDEYYRSGGLHRVYVCEIEKVLKKG